MARSGLFGDATVKPTMHPCYNVLLTTFYLWIIFVIRIHINANIELTGAKSNDIVPEQQWLSGAPGEGYFAKQPNAYVGLATTSKVSVGTLSTVWINEFSILLMDDEAHVATDTWSSLHIYGRLNLGKRTGLSSGRYTHFATYGNRTVSFGDRCQVRLDYWSSVYILDNFFMGFNSELRFGESSRTRISSCGHPACVIGDHSRLILGISAAMDVHGAIILLNAANITLDRLAHLVLEPNSSLATALPKPVLYIGEQSRVLVQRHTHCLMIDDIFIPPRTIVILSPQTSDDKIKCFGTQNRIKRQLKPLMSERLLQRSPQFRDWG